MAEAIISPIASKIVTNLVPQALENAGKLWGVKHELEALGDIASMIQAVLGHAEEIYYKNPQIKDWVDKLKDAFYDTQDLLEEFNAEAMQRELRGHYEMMEEVRIFFSSSNQLAFKMKMSYKLRGVRERLKAIVYDKEFHLDERPKREWRKREETHSFTMRLDIIGRDDDKKTVIKFLLDSNVQENLSILPIVGIGGVGKTALAQCVYNDEMVSKQFNLKMWVCVSIDFNMKKIVKDMVASAKQKEPTEGVMELLISELMGQIDGKRYLLVLDDLWNVEQETWLSLKTLLLRGARGSKILITTRHPLVADITGTAPAYLLEGLSESASLELLMQAACCKEEELQDPDMLALVKDIARKCYGVPLALRTIGNLLFNKSKHEWAQFKENELPKVSQREDGITLILKLSYDNLPSHLKKCFAFCSLFPKDYEIKKQTLVNLWMAEGFIQQSNGNRHLEDIGHQYFMDLLWGNFFQDFQKDSFMNKETCKIPALMHDLACVVAGFEYWVARDDPKYIPERIRHISHGLTSNLMGEFPILLLKARSLRTFLSVPTSHEMEQRKPTSEVDLCQLIQSFKRLRILDLHAAIVKKVPRSICKALVKKYCGLGELNGLNDIRESLSIENLGHSQDAIAESMAANLKGKRFLESLILKWSYLDTDDAAIGDTDKDLLDKLMPNSNLQKLTIDGYEGVHHLSNLVHLSFSNCEELDLSKGESDNVKDSQGLESLRYGDHYFPVFTGCGNIDIDVVVPSGWLSVGCP
ncbi:putative disease resistance protein RGA4 [Eucalyptus grandis]|uniref:putative disease resistance protein RGA4 n=1 Tax=Eucalyptus grandis TaxID=71139 RepID=UPI00192EE219|nr:putative disease resistance protein RGA4 [Eucalyptus grandis]